MHPFSGLQALYDAKGDLILKVEEYYVPPRRLWFSNNLNKIGFVDELTMRCNGISEANVEPAGRRPIGLDDLRPFDLQPGLPLAASVGLS